MLKEIILASCITALSAGCTTDRILTASQSSSTYVVTVGMENSSHFGACPGAEKDCTRMTDIFKTYTTNVKSFVSAQATKANVVAAMKEAVEKSELFIFYYSGHGGSYSSGNANEADKCDEFLCFNDTYMMDDEIWNIVSQSKGRVFLIFDCCHSETMYRAKNPFSFKKIPLTATHNQSGSVNILVWSGCPDDTYSYGSSTGGQMTNTLRSYFTRTMTYDSLWTKMENNISLQQYEMIQRTIIGNKDAFGSKYIFQ